MSAITCGKCKSTHTTVEAVKACHAGAQPAQPFVGSQAEQQYINEGELLPCEVAAIASGKAQPVPAITEKQEAFLNRLLDERPAMRDVENLHPDVVARMTKADASRWINDVMASPKESVQSGKAQAQVEQAAERNALVTEGYYAIDIDDTVKFYRVDKPTEGKWAGYTFLKVQASDEFYPIKGHAAQRIFDTIEAQGVKESMVRYGQLIGRCGICNRTLTDETSRAMGIGPVCREGF